MAYVAEGNFINKKKQQILEKNSLDCKKKIVFSGEKNKKIVSYN